MRPRVPSSSARSEKEAFSLGVPTSEVEGQVYSRYLSVLVVERPSPSSSWVPLPRRSHPSAAVVSVVVCQPMLAVIFLTRAGAQRLWGWRFTMDHIFNIFAIFEVCSL